MMHKHGGNTIFDYGGDVLFGCSRDAYKALCQCYGLLLAGYASNDEVGNNGEGHNTNNDCGMKN